MKSLLYILCGVAAIQLSACAVPDVDRSLAEVAPAGFAGRIVDARGPLSGQQSAALLRVVGVQAGHDGDELPALLDRHRRVEEKVAGEPLTAGNRVTLLRDGDGTFAAVFDAVQSAKHHINLEYYTIEDIDHDGRKLSDLLIAKRRAGVAVNVIYDSFGSSETPSEFFDRLRAAGAQVLEFHPVNPLDAVAAGYSPNDRNHRKIAVIDGRVAILGGVNLARYYQSRIPGSDAEMPAGEPPTEGGPPPKTWRDISLRIEGPAVAQLQRLFLGHWRSGGGEKLDQTGFFPKLPVKDGEIARIIGSSPQQEISRFYVTLISAIRSAQMSIHLTTAYFVPTDEEVEALVEAARRGVDVRLMLPADSDASEAVTIARSHYEDLLEAGVRIFEMNGYILHSKTVTIDGVWSAVGSSNFDHRSVLFNDEVDAIVLGVGLARDLRQRFIEDSAHAHEVTRAEWQDRSLLQKLSDIIHRPWQALF